MSHTVSQISEKLEELTPTQLAQVDRFISYLQMDEEERMQSVSFSMLSEAALRKVWDNPEDDVYNDM